MPDHGLYKREKLFYENRVALEGDAATAFIPVLFDAFDGSPIIDTSDDDAIPPSLVLEGGNFSLAVSSISHIAAERLERTCKGKRFFC